MCLKICLSRSVSDFHNKTVLHSVLPIHRKLPGTPGTGKTRLSKELAKKFGFDHLDISAVAKENDFVEEYDEEYECPVLDEEKVKCTSMWEC